MAFKYCCNLFIILLAIRKTTCLCVGASQSVCLTGLTDEDAEEKLKYILDKYEEVEMKIVGKPVTVHGKRISYGSMQEYNIGFRYIDNTENDIIQYCEFVLLYAPGQCESISLFCNTFLSRTPRPLLKRDTLTICEDGVPKATGQDETNIENKQNEGNQETTTSNVKKN